MALDLEMHGGKRLTDDLVPREAEAVSKLLDLAKFSILAMLVGVGALGVDSLGII